MAVPVLMYGSETRTLTENKKKCMETVQSCFIQLSGRNIINTTHYKCRYFTKICRL